MKSKIRRRIARLAICFVAGLGLAVLGLVLGWFWHEYFRNREFPLKWIELLGFTLMVFWYPMQDHRRDWSRASFWCTLGALLIVHLVGFIILLSAYPEWHIVWFVPTSILELWAVNLSLDKVTRHDQSIRGQT